MSLEHWEQLMRAAGNNEAAARGRALREQYGDVPLPSTTKPQIADLPVDTFTIPVIDIKALLEREKGAIDRIRQYYVSNTGTPENLADTYDIIWGMRMARLVTFGIDQSLTVSPCAYSQEELDGLAVDGRRVGYIPPEIATEENIHLLGVMFPIIGSDFFDQNNIRIEEFRSGWFDYEFSIEPPFMGHKQVIQRNEIKRLGRRTMNLIEYIIATQDSELFSGQYLDEGASWTRLLGSRIDGEFKHVQCDRNGRLRFNTPIFDKTSGDPYLGTRSVGRPKAA